MSKKKEIYKNSPLIETVFEIRFPENLTIECNIDKFYNKLKNYFPKILKPKIYQTTEFNINIYHFVKNDEQSGIIVSINKIAYFEKKYEGFAKFKKNALKFFSIFGLLYGIEKLSRTGLRYINVIPFIRNDGVIPLEKYLDVKLGFPEPISCNFKNIGIIIDSQIKGGSITTRIESALSPMQNQEVLILDFDYSKEENLKFSEIEKYIDESHLFTKMLFEKITTEDYKKIMRGEVK